MKLQYWTGQIDNTTGFFKQYFGGLTSKELYWKPAKDRWSIAQNIDHLITINETYFKVVADIRAGHYHPPFISRLGFLVSLFGGMIYNASKPDRKKKIKTFAIWQPSDGTSQDNALIRFEEHHEELKELIRSSMDLVADGMVISSPANKHIVYTLEKAFDIMIIHEQRHLEQAKEVLSMMKTNGVSTAV